MQQLIRSHLVTILEAAPPTRDHLKQYQTHARDPIATPPQNQIKDVEVGLTATLYGEITIKEGRIEQANFDSYRPLRMEEAPAIEVHIVDSKEEPGGIGEPGTSTIAPAVVNAIFALTGKRLRRLPVDASELKAVQKSSN